MHETPRKRSLVHLSHSTHCFVALEMQLAQDPSSNPCSSCLAHLEQAASAVADVAPAVPMLNNGPPRCRDRRGSIDRPSQLPRDRGYSVRVAACVRSAEDSCLEAVRGVQAM